MDLKYRRSVVLVVCLVLVNTQIAYTAPTIGVTSDILIGVDQTEPTTTATSRITTAAKLVETVSIPIPTKQPLAKGRDKISKPFFYKKSRDKTLLAHLSTITDLPLPTPSPLTTLSHKPVTKDNNIPTTIASLLSSGYSTTVESSKYFDTLTLSNKRKGNGTNLFTSGDTDMTIATPSTMSLVTSTLDNNSNGYPRPVTELIAATTSTTASTNTKANIVFATDFGTMKPEIDSQHQRTILSTAKYVPDMNDASSTLKVIGNYLNPHIDIVTTTMESLKPSTKSISDTTKVKDPDTEKKQREDGLVESHLLKPVPKSSIPLEKGKIVRFVDFKTNNSKSINKQNALSLVTSTSSLPPFLASLSLVASISASTLSPLANAKNAQVSLTDVGHDGVKTIKKKQLSHSKHIRNDDEFAMNKNKSNVKISEKGSKEELKDTKIRDGKQLKGTANVRSEPVFMKEKIFKVNKSGKNDKPGIVIVEEESKAVIRHGGKLSHKVMMNEKISTPVPIFYHYPTEAIEILDKSTVMQQAASEMMLTTMKVTVDSTIINDDTAKPIPDIIGPNDMDIVFRSFVTTMPTITVDPTMTSHTPKPFKPLEKIQIEKSEQIESRISDIQIEIIESTQTQGSLAAATTTIKPEYEQPTSALNLNTENIPKILEAENHKKDSNKIKGKPEPAAIEIHINVSEGFGGDSEDLEFSYRQSDISKMTSGFNSGKNNNSETITLKPVSDGSNETEEILVVEIIDGNGTDTSISKENFSEYPKFTIQSHLKSENNEKFQKYAPSDLKSESKESDDIFVPDLKSETIGNDNGDGSSIIQTGKDQFDKDSDTIFYISNTEVKVGESIPTQNTNLAGNDDDGHKLVKHTKLETEFFPAVYEEDVRIDFATKNKSGNHNPERYEEDIILSPLKSNFDPLKAIENQNQNIGKSNPLDISYVGETFIEVEEAAIITTIAPSIVTNDERPMEDSITPNVIIEPANLPEISIGVPIIGELPPQIELKEIDFMPESAASDISGRSGYDDDRLESSIQYGGDLIEDNVDMIGGSDLDVDGGYPFGRNFRKANRAAAAKMQQMVNNLKRDELIADIGSSEDAEALVIREGLIRKLNDSSNSTITEKMANATAFSVMEEYHEISLTDLQTLLLACVATLIPLICVLMLAYGLRYLWRKYREDSNNGSGLIGDCSTDPIASKSQDELKSSESECTINRSNDTLDSNSEIVIRNSDCETGNVGDSDVGCSSNNGCLNIGIHIKGGNDIKSSGRNFEKIGFGPNGLAINLNKKTATYLHHHDTITEENNISTFSTTPPITTMSNIYSGVNGSVTTMTLKNNHLIVETEERNDISRDARETKMHYNTSEKDGVFVVEVSRGADSQGLLGSPSLNAAKQNLHVEKMGNGFAPCLEEVQIHPPPNEELNNSLHQIDEAEEPESPKSIPIATSNTGLSQSDLSSSSTDSNKRYAYGNQELYTIEKDVYSNSNNPPKSITPTGAESPRNGRKYENGDCQHRPNPKNNYSNNDDGNDKNGGYNNDMNKTEQKRSNIETKPIITAALLKQETVIEIHPIIPGLKSPTPPQMHITKADVSVQENKPIKANEPTSVVEPDIILNGKIDEKLFNEPLRFNGIPITAEDDIQMDLNNAEDESIVNADLSTLPYVNSNSIRNDQKEQFAYLAPAFNKTNDCPVIFNGQIINDDTENGFDSIMSLPDPPSCDEMNTINENTSMDVNQLDSLPPPPPPSNFCEYKNQNDTKSELKQNGDVGHQTINNNNNNNDVTNDDRDDDDDDEEDDDDRHSSITSQPSTINSLTASNIGAVAVAATGSS